MHRNTRRALRVAIIATIAAAPLGGCYSASGTRLGSYSNSMIDDGMSVGDTLGAAMFQQDVQIAAANARRLQNTRSNFATVNVPVD